MRLALTRPLPDGERTAAALRARGHDVLLTPLLRVEPVDTDLAGTIAVRKWTGVIVTSANALRATEGQLAALTALPLYAVGARTADAAREAGFTDVRSADGDAGDLVRFIVTQADKNLGPLLYLAAEQSGADLEQLLAPHGVTVTTKIVYRTVTLPLPQAVADALKGGHIDAVLHFSKRSAETFLASAAVIGVTAQALAARHICLSDQVAAPLIAAGAKNIAIAAHPDENAMILLAGSA